MRRLGCLVFIAATLGLAMPAQAICIYRGVLYAKSTVTGEVRESSLVIKGTVIETYDIEPADPEGALDSYAVARIRVDEVFKGAAGREVFLISERNSGGFYVDPGVQYLLFLGPPVRAGWSNGYDPEAIAEVQLLPRPRFINHSCGQSVPWAELGEPRRKVLAYETRRLRQE